MRQLDIGKRGLKWPLRIEKFERIILKARDSEWNSEERERERERKRVSAMYL